MEEDPSDPEIPDQKYVCISYAPHPDHNTIYFKVRGSYETMVQAQERAMYLHHLNLEKKAEMEAQGIPYPLLSIYVGEVGKFLAAQSDMIDFSEPNTDAPDIPINIISESVDETVPSDPTKEEPESVDSIQSRIDPDIVNDATSCLACQTTKRDALFMPCRHICFCLDCTNIHIKKDKECPICRTSIKEILNVFIN